MAQKDQFASKLDQVLAAIEQNSARLINLESQFNSFDKQLKAIDQKFSERCSTLENGLAALDLNVQEVNDRISVVESSINAKLEEIDEKQEIRTGVEAKFEQRLHQLEKENIMHESYSKRLNLLVHGLEERKSEIEIKQQTKSIFETFLTETLELEINAVNIVDLHRLPQHPIKKNGIRINQPVIVKVLTTFDKDIIFQNAAKLRSYNESRDSPVYITDHLPKLFYNKKKSLRSQFLAAKKEGKKTKWAAYDGKYCLYIDNKRFEPIM